MRTLTSLGASSLEQPVAPCPYTQSMIYTCANTAKLLLKSMTEALIPWPLVEEAERIVASVGVTPADASIQMVLLFSLLPDDKVLMLNQLLRLLQLICQYPSSRMTNQSLMVVVAPALLHEDSPEVLVKLKDDQYPFVRLFYWLIENGRTCLNPIIKQRQLQPF